jgi:hypothetical protein
MASSASGSYISVLAVTIKYHSLIGGCNQHVDLAGICNGVYMPKPIQAQNRLSKLDSQTCSITHTHYSKRRSMLNANVNRTFQCDLCTTTSPQQRQKYITIPEASSSTRVGMILWRNMNFKVTSPSNTDRRRKAQSLVTLKKIPGDLRP